MHSNFYLKTQIGNRSLKFSLKAKLVEVVAQELSSSLELKVYTMSFSSPFPYFF